MPRARARSHQEPGNLTPTGLPTPPTGMLQSRLFQNAAVAALARCIAGSGPAIERGDRTSPQQIDPDDRACAH